LSTDGVSRTVSDVDRAPDKQIDSGNMEIVERIPIRVAARIGTTRMSLERLIHLGKGSVIQLDTLYGDDVTLIAGDRELAKGQIVVVRDTFGLKITETRVPRE